jgi:hypothetical protein
MFNTKVFKKGRREGGKKNRKKLYCFRRWERKRAPERVSCRWDETQKQVQIQNMDDETQSPVLVQVQAILEILFFSQSSYPYPTQV